MSVRPFRIDSSSDSTENPTGCNKSLKTLNGNKSELGQAPVDRRHNRSLTSMFAAERFSD
jgi:hypothetical protein